MTRDEWIARFAGALGIEVPSDDDVDAILDLAGEAAHASERTAAPIACWVAAVAGRSPSDAVEVARSLRAETDAM
jgi:hypothetical protein